MASPPKNKSLEVSVSDSVQVTEKLHNHKQWFNGIKKFIAIRLK